MPEMLFCAQDPATGEVRPKPCNEPESSDAALQKPSTEEAMPSLEAASTSVQQEQPTEQTQTEGSRRENEQKVVA